MNSDKIDELLISTYLERFREFEGLFPAAVNRCRQPAIESFRLLGLPDKSDERYKYTDLKALFQRKYRDFQVSFCGGEDGKVWSSADGAVSGDLSAFVRGYPELVEKYYNASADNEKDGVTALNTAFASGGQCIYVPRGVRVEEPFRIQVKGWCGEDGRVIAGRRDLFVFERGSEARVVIHYDKRIGLVNRVCEVFVEAGANVEIVEYHGARGGEEGVCVNSVYVRQERDSVFHSNVVVLGGETLRNNQTVRLLEPGAECRLYGTVVVDGDRHVDNYTSIQHETPDADSYEHFKSIVGERALSAFNGRIYVAQDAQRTQSFQENNNLLLSDGAHIYSKPQLEIYADDVKCSHGATIGQLDDEAVFYMRQRGIGLQEARKLQMIGFVSDILQKIGIASVRDEMEEKVREIVGALK